MNLQHHYLLTASILLLSACGGKSTTHSAQIGESCDRQKQCLQGLFCEDGTCRKPCINDDDCQNTQKCENSRCVTLSNAADANCGNGREDTGEACDDGNKRSNDGCSAKCNIEPNYLCTGWPSECKCASGYQDSNHDGTCQKDCDTCGDLQVCGYNIDGTAAGCICREGYQDSNSDGICQPDCTSCPDNQSCIYSADGMANCGCPEGSQDNNNDGICAPACRPEMCGNYESCDDSSGEALCVCTIYVTPEGDSTGLSWEKPANLGQALTSAQQQMMEKEVPSCKIFMAKGLYQISKQNNKESVKLQNIEIYGGFDNPVSTSEDESTYARTEISGSAVFQPIFTITDSRAHLENLLLTSGGMKWLLKGGAIYMENSDLTIKNILFYKNGTYNENSGGTDGSAIYQNGGHLTVTACEFANNTAQTGTVYIADGSSTTITDTLFSSNFGHGDAAAIYNEGQLVLENDTFIDNYLADSMSTNAINIYNGFISTRQQKQSQVTINRCQFLDSNINGPAPSQYASCKNSFTHSNIQNSVGKVVITNSVFSSHKMTPLNTDKDCINDGIITTQYSPTGELGLSETTLAFSLVQNIDTPEGSKAIYMDNGTVTNNLTEANIAIGEKQKNALIYQYRNISDFSYNLVTYTDIELGQAVNNLSKGSVRTNRTTISLISKTVTTEGQTAGLVPGSLVGKYMVDKDNFTVPVVLPILENGTDYIVVPGNPFNFQLLRQDEGKPKKLASMFSGKALVIQDLRQIIDDSNVVIDKASTTRGPQPADDFFGNHRPDTKKDIGPVEIKAE